ncbi:plasmid mobilization protein [Nostoc sp.]
MTRTAKVNFRATEQEVVRIKQLAAIAGYSQSEYIRLVALGFPVQPVETK